MSKEISQAESQSDTVHVSEQPNYSKNTTSTTFYLFFRDKNTSSVAEYEEAFEQTGHGRFNRLATLCCSLIFIHALIEMVAFAYIITPAKCDLHLTVTQNSAVSSSVFIGILLSAICWGILGDLYGRKKIMLPALLTSVLTSFISSLCTGFWLMLTMRFLTGIFVSASAAMVLVYLAELQNTSHRDRHVSIVIASSQFSFFFVTGFAWLLIPGSWAINIGSLRIRPWRVFMWLWGVVGLCGASILIFLPESPRYIVAVEGPERAIPVLAKIYAWNHRTTADQFPVKTIDAKTVPRREMKVRKDVSELMKTPMRKCVYLTHGAMFVIFLLNNGFYIWHSTNIMNAAVSSYSESMSMCELILETYGLQNETIDEGPYEPLLKLALNSLMGFSVVPFLDDISKSPTECTEGEINTMVYPFTLLMEVFYFGPFVAVVLLINKFQKVWLYGIIMWSCSCGLILTSIVPQMTVAFCFLVMGLACGSCCSIITAMAVDAFPTTLRGLATCTMYMVGQLGAVVGTSVLGLMIGWTCILVFVIIAGACTGSALALIFMWPDTKEVRSTMESKGFSY